MTGIARFVGSAAGVVHEGDRVINWMGEAELFHLSPPLNGFSTVVASTVAHAVSVRADGGVDVGGETFLFGLTGEGLQIDPEWSELPGSAWGATAATALADAGYRLAAREETELVGALR